MNRTCINEGWTFTKPGDKPVAVSLPHTWNNFDGQDGGNDYFRGQCSYERAFKIEAGEGENIHLEFEAANSVARVSVNDIEVGTHKGGYSAFRCDIGKAVKRGGINVIRVDVDNSDFDDIYPKMADFTFMGGLYRDAHLIVSQPVHIDLDDDGSQGVYVSQTSVTHARADLSIEVLLNNTSGADATIEYVVELSDATGAGIDAASTRLTFAGRTRATLALTVDNPVLWQGTENPYLYSLAVRILSDGVEIDRRTIPTGLRFFEVSAEKGFFLNGKPWRLNGVCRHQCREDIGWALKREHMDEDMAMIEEIGSNSIRLAHYQHNQYFYDLCDRAGMVVWAEIPYISVTSDSDTTGANALSQMKELVKQNYNHPSIIFWGIQNEITIGGTESNLRGIVSALHEQTKQLDPYRLTTQAQVGHLPDDDPLNAVSDVNAYNKYFGWYYSDIEGMDRWISRFRATCPEIPLGISEYGAEAILQYHSDTPEKSDYTETYQALYHEKTLEIFARHENLWGTYVWNMFDFASDLRDEGGVKGKNNKGLVTHDHQTRKDSFFIYQAHWSKKPMLHITGKRFVKRATDTISVKIYSNAPQVTLFVNGAEFASKASDAKVYVFDNVPLVAGNTVIEARSDTLCDTATFIRVDEPEASYVVPKGENEIMGSVANWFTGDEFQEVLPIEIRAGYFSVQDRICDIAANPNGKAYLDKYLAELFDHPMYPMLKNIPLEKLGEFKPDVFTPAIISGLNQGLVEIAKS